MRPDRDSIHRRAIRLGAAAFLVGLGLTGTALAHELGEVVALLQLPIADPLVALVLGLVALVLGLGALVLRAVRRSGSTGLGGLGGAVGSPAAGPAT